MYKRQVIHIPVIGGGLVADVDQEKDAFELCGGVKIILDHFPPLGLGLLGYLGITVAGQVHKIELAVYVVVIDGLSLAGLSGCLLYTSRCV